MNLRSIAPLAALCALAAACAGDDAARGDAASADELSDFPATVIGVGSGTLSVRREPRLSAPVLARLRAGQRVGIGCQAEGDAVGGTTIWNFLPALGGYATDAFLNTGHDGFIPGVPRCGAPPPPPPPPEAFFSISPDQDSFLDGQQPQTLRALGAQIVRLKIRHQWPNDETRRVVDAALAAGLEVILEINYETFAGTTTEDWHAGFLRPGQGPADDGSSPFAQAYVAAARDIARTFAGRVRGYEIWNEPNTAPPGNNDWLRACAENHGWGVCPRLMGTLVTNAFMAIKEADPQARVIAGNLLTHGPDGAKNVANQYWAEVERSPAVAWHRQNKGRPPWDIVAIHPYGYPKRDGTFTLEQALDSFRATLDASGDRSPLAITEYGWNADPNAPAGNRALDERDQADLLRRAFDVGRQKGLSFVTWFNYLDWHGGAFEEAWGLRRLAPGAPNSTPGAFRPAARAYCEASGAPACPAP